MNNDNFKWSAVSAFRKLTSGLYINIGNNISITKQLTPDNNPQRDAYRNCSNCNKHYNFHKNGKCVYNLKN